MRILSKSLGLLFGVLILSLLFQNVMATQSSLYTSQRLDDSVGSWHSWKTFVNIKLENDAKDNVSTYSFSSENVTGWMNFGFETIRPLNVTNNFLFTSLKIATTNLSIPLALTVIDSSGSRRGYYSIPKSYALSEGAWSNIIIDLSNFQWQDSNFNVSDLSKFFFSVHNDNNTYSQKVWIRDFQLLSNNNLNSISIEPQTANYHLVMPIMFLIIILGITGFVLFNLLKLNFPSEWNFALAIPFYIGFGVVSLVLLLSCLCLLNFDFATASFVVAAIVALASVIVWKRVHIQLLIKDLKNIRFLLPLCLFIFSLIIFLRLSIDIGWGAYVDSQTHGLYTSLILSNSGFPFSSFPIGDLSISPLRYPMGFHSLSAFSSLISGLHPGQAILAVATALVCFLPSLIYSIVYSYTKSLKISLIAFILIFVLPGSSPVLWQTSQNLLLGGFLVGAYPNLLGNLICVVMLSLIVFFMTNSGGYLSRWKIPLIFLILLGSIFFGYYSLLPFTIAFLLLNTLVDKLKASKKNPWTMIIILAILFLIVFVGFSVLLKDSLSSLLNLDNSLLHSIYMRYPIFDLNSVYIVYGIFTLIGFGFAIWFLFKPALRSVSLFYLVFFLPLIVAQNESLYSNYLWFIQPDRVLILLVVFSYIITLFGIFELNNVPSIRRKFSSILKIKYKKNEFKLTWAAIGLVLILCVPSLLSFTTYTYPTTVKTCLPNSNDLKALEWLAENGSSSGFILNDRTVIGLWASSLKAMPLINEREILLKLCVFGTLNGTSLGNRTYEANYILDYPWDYDAIKNIAVKYNISYIYLTDAYGIIYERGQAIWPFPWSHLSQEERILMYLQNPYLRVVYRAGNAIIFNVDCTFKQQ